MPRVLLSAFGPYDIWQENASWLVLAELTRRYAGGLDLTTRRYPVDFDAVRDRMSNDLKSPFDVVLCMGQSPGRWTVQIERFAINFAGSEQRLLADDGPAAYRSRLPLDEWCSTLRSRGVPTIVSNHAGDYLCNAAMYYAHYWNERYGHDCQTAFIHLPLTPQQAIASGRDLPSLPLEVSVTAIELLLAMIGQPAIA